MKNLIKIFLIAIGFVAIQSCDDDLAQLPNDSVSPDSFYKTTLDFEAAIRGVYSGFLRSTYYGGSFLSRPDIMTANVILAPAGRRSNQSFYEWRHTPNAAWNLMGSGYIITNRANLILEYISNVNDVQFSNNIIGEAKTARALALFDLLRIYSKIPTQSLKANESLGMPIIVEIDPTIQKLRPTVKESYDFIISELEEAKNLINEDNGTGRFNKNTVNALLSRVYLYNGDYQLSVEAANSVSSTVATRSNFPQVWVDGSEDGVIMKIDQDRILDGIGIGTQWSQSVDGNVIPEYVMGFDLYNQYLDTDIRRTSYTQVLPDSDGNIYNAVKKMFGEAGQNNGVVDVKIIRASEVYLNKAEAYAMLGQDGPALTALDAVRSNRYNNFSSGNETGTQLFEAIKLERRLELFAEGHRLFDLKRWNEGVTRSLINGDFFDGTGSAVSAEYSSLPAGSYIYQFPIPQAEINVFPEFQQNPGYNNN
ncbi:MAG: RagB/SusD family nutrient uptake outer membrane protein [Polaribacter sp.]|jgi:hypothetical protein|nr:RagB/SusD family nutrient uptake outer membrane protein [Polaribacter sp.]MDG2357881.1 RagB/SusD family nutrient uptake outer membrane protein [Polaribacter sp.]